MEQLFDPMRKILELAETGRESLEHVLQGIKQGKVQTSLYLLPELVDAFMSINESIAVFSEDLPPNEIDKKSEAVANDLSTVCLALEAGNIADIGDLIQESLLASYRDWQLELSECFSPLVLS